MFLPEGTNTTDALDHDFFAAEAVKGGREEGHIDIEVFLPFLMQQLNWSGRQHDQQDTPKISNI